MKRKRHPFLILPAALTAAALALCFFAGCNKAATNGPGETGTPESTESTESAENAENVSAPTDEAEDAEDRIVGFCSIEKQNEGADEAVDIAAFYKSGAVKTVYTFIAEDMKDFVSSGNILYETKNVSIACDNNRLFIQINKKLYYIDLSGDEIALTDTGIQLEENAEKIYAVDDVVYLKTHYPDFKKYDMRTGSLTDLTADGYDIFDFVIDETAKTVFFTDTYDSEAEVTQSLYYAPLSDINDAKLIYASPYNGTDLKGAYENTVLYSRKGSASDYTIYNVRDNTAKNISVSTPGTVRYIDGAVYYTRQTYESDGNGGVKNYILKLYKFPGNEAIYTFAHGTQGNRETYIGNGLFLFSELNRENNVMIDTGGNERDLLITNLAGETEKLEITKYYNINFDYAEMD